jgi:TolA-binding protein
MKRYLAIIVGSAIAVAFVAAIGQAQMGSGMMGHMQKSDSTMTSTRPSMANQEQLVKDVINDQQNMSMKFDQLQTHLKQMMQIKDMKQLKSEMMKQQQLMDQFHNMMMHQTQMDQRMEAMMTGSPNSMGMQGGSTHKGWKKSDPNKKN